MTHHWIIRTSCEVTQQVTQKLCNLVELISEQFFELVSDIRVSKGLCWAHSGQGSCVMTMTRRANTPGKHDNKERLK